MGANGIEGAVQVVEPDSLTLAEWRAARAAEHDRQAHEDAATAAARAAKRAALLARRRAVELADPEPEPDPLAEWRACLPADRRPGEPDD
jgi:hypothetical protein